MEVRRNGCNHTKHSVESFRYIKRLITRLITSNELIATHSSSTSIQRATTIRLGFCADRDWTSDDETSCCRQDIDGNSCYSLPAVLNTELASTKTTRLSRKRRRRWFPETRTSPSKCRRQDSLSIAIICAVDTAANHVSLLILCRRCKVP